MQIFGFLGSFLGYILWGAFYLLQDFGLSIIVFTVIVKLCLFPFSVKQQKSMAGTAKLSKKQKEIQEKYANNKQKAQEEMQKLYEKEGVKPMGGCVTMIIPFLVLFGIFYAVAYPLTNTLHLSSDAVSQAVSYINTIPGYVSANTNATYQEVSFLTIFPNICNTDAIKSIFTSAEISQLSMFYKGFNTFGIDLLAVPSQYGLFSPYILFPVLCFLSNVGSQFVMQKINNQMAQQQGCMKLMLYAMPLFSAWIAYSVPAAMGFYWIISAVLGLVQSILLNKIFSPVQLTANSEARHVALMFENEAKTPYVYAPKEMVSAKNATVKQNKKNKKK
jgi:YidC/Oxa1 family membrane protein insertase